jgi:hypothetical protein
MTRQWKSVRLFRRISWKYIQYCTIFRKMCIDSIGTVENFHRVSNAVYVYGMLLDDIVLQTFKANEKRNESIIDCIQFSIIQHCLH